MSQNGRGNPNGVIISADGWRHVYRQVFLKLSFFFFKFFFEIFLVIFSWRKNGVVERQHQVDENGSIWQTDSSRWKISRRGIQSCDFRRLKPSSSNSRPGSICLGLPLPPSNLTRHQPIFQQSESESESVARSCICVRWQVPCIEAVSGLSECARVLSCDRRSEFNGD